MGQIVGGFATSHVLFSPESVEAEAERVLQGMTEIRSRLHALKPDVLVIAGSDHANNFTLRQQVTLAVGVADEYVPLGDMGIAQTPFRGHRDFGESLARYAAECGFDLVQVEEVRPDHGMALTKLAVDPTDLIPTVLIYINSNMPVPPSPARSFALGDVLRKMVNNARSGSERVVVVGSGGMSHWLRVPGQGRIAADFDRRFLNAMVEGHSDVLARLSTEELENETGNGGLELTAWLLMAGSLGRAVGEIIYYEPIKKWDTGMGGVQLFATPEDS
ncbi:protocatechuate 4,5-dioxygenase [Caballeronia arvi]|uniref:Protocatechuate 4,5-dioxygenase n=1 Tax=Caballeronia arvi TaxID=1777135 RepID=A0A158KIE1_9BURK|nr:hypothetical protein [Caballeronia arvi]SAL80814.1 protocatechuate 4,5-dioxygenase [Caballeronia arvi]